MSDRARPDDGRPSGGTTIPPKVRRARDVAVDGATRDADLATSLSRLLGVTTDARVVREALAIVERDLVSAPDDVALERGRQILEAALRSRLFSSE
jgi:hypothetical protein